MLRRSLPTLLVPGTQATTLVDGAGRTVYNAVRISLGLDRDALGGRLPNRWDALLSLAHDHGQWQPRLRSLETGTTLHPGRVVRTPYARLHARLDAQDWPYDWRCDLRWNAQRLLDDLDRLRPADAPRWTLIGHSQGALIIVLAARLAQLEATDGLEQQGRLVEGQGLKWQDRLDGSGERRNRFTRHVAKVALVGAPLAGSLRALEALLAGRDDLGTRHIDRTRAMARTWPAIYQMLPAWPACRGGPAFTLPEGYPSPWHIGLDTELLSRARATHDLLRDPTSAFEPGVAVQALFSEADPDTPQALTWAPDTGFSCRRPRRDRAATVPCREFAFDSCPGDSLVPVAPTLEWCGADLARRSVIVSGPVRGHALLCDDEDVVELIETFVKRDSAS
jgi:hypothetical protein